MYKQIQETERRKKERKEKGKMKDRAMRVFKLKVEEKNE